MQPTSSRTIIKCKILQVNENCKYIICSFDFLKLLSQPLITEPDDYSHVYSGKKRSSIDILILVNTSKKYIWRVQTVKWKLQIEKESKFF